MKNNLIKNSKNIVLATVLGLSFSSFAQEEKPAESKTTVSGFIDGYYKFDAGQSGVNNKTKHTRSHNSFEIGSANLLVEHTQGKAKFFGDFGVGRRIDALNTNAQGSTSVLIKELNINFEVISGLNITAGTFQRHFGVEKINVNANANYSMSYGYSISPLLNTGVKANYSVDGFNVMIGASNAADFKSAVDANTTQKTILAQVGYTAENTNLSVNYQTASHNPSDLTKVTMLNRYNYSLYNVTLKQKFDDKLSVALDANMVTYTPDGKNTKDRSVLAVAGYVKYAVQENLGLAYRLEYFDDKDKANVINVAGGNVISNTISANYKLGNLTVVPELRADIASEEIFYVGNKASKVSPFLLLGAVYNF